MSFQPASRNCDDCPPTFRATTLPDGTRTQELDASLPSTDFGTALTVGTVIEAFGVALLAAASSPRSRA